MNISKTLVLCILDGWGIGPDNKWNAIKNANPIFFNSLIKNYPWSELHTSAEHVGLPDGQMGNSEVGHATIGAGRVIEQDLPRINSAIKSGKLFQHKAIKTIKGDCHIIALMSDGGVHSHIDHQIALSAFLAKCKVNVKLHLMTDGRDTSPRSAITFAARIKKELLDVHSNISVATVSGRYYAMDRDNRFERTEEAYKAIATGANKTFIDIRDPIKHSYHNNITDEFIKPQSAMNYDGIQNGDAVICTNFRSDRMRQICEAIFLPQFNKFKRKLLKLSAKIIMTSYSQEIDSTTYVLVPPISIKDTLPEILSRCKMPQFRIAETEKYPHITFFFNAGREEPYSLEERMLIDSPKVSTYDLQPEMSAYKITDRLEAEILSGKYQFLLVNYANADMVGHTGNYAATMKAISTVDSCLQRIYDATMKMDGALIITADHGNAEDMFDHHNDLPHTAHTTNPVPFIVVNKRFLKEKTKIKNGTLADIAPTILNLYGIKVPKEMTGKNLIGSHEQSEK